MEFEISRETLLPALRILTGIVERKQTLPVLANILLRLEKGRLYLTSTDSELEMACSLALEATDEGATTLPAFKLFDICRSLGENAMLHFTQDGHRMQVKSGRSRFSLSYLPAEDFPASDEIEPLLEFSLPQQVLKKLFARTQFAMAQQDVRYYLNGLLLELKQDILTLVATDGHRLALAEETFKSPGEEPLQVIIPRKAVLELSRSLEDNDEAVEIAVAGGHIRFKLPTFTLSSKLIDGRFPDYRGAIPAHPDLIMTTECNLLKQSLSRAAILSSEKYKGVRLGLTPGHLTINAHNPEQEEAEEEMDVAYQGSDIEVGFNVVYLLEALNAVEDDEVEMCFVDAGSSCLIRPKGNGQIKYVVMPMRL